MRQITVYTKPNCPSCVKAKNLLTSRGQSYNEVVIGQDIVREEFLSCFPTVRTVPHVIIDGAQIGSYDNLVEFFNNVPTFLTE